MRKLPLLPTLGLTAVAGALVFLALTMPPRDPQALAAEKARVMQGRAAEAAERSESASNAAAGEEPVRAGNPPPMTTAQAARLKAAQREFLINPEIWPPEVAADLTVVWQSWHTWRARWIGRVLGSRTAPADMGSVGVRIFRRKADVLCADLTKLSPAAKKKGD